MSRNCSGGGYTFGCLVIIGVYGVLISVAFTIVTALYMTVESCEKIEAEIARVVKVTHVDAFNQDNSYNGVQEPVEPVDEEEEVDKCHPHDHKIFCDCGTQGIWTFFEIIVMVAAVTGLLFMATMIIGMCRGTFVKSRERRLRSEKEKKDKMEEENIKAVLAKLASGELEVPETQKTGSKNSKIELPV